MAEGSVTWWKRKRVALAAALAVLAAFTFLGNWAPSAGLRWGVVKALHALGMSEVALGGADMSLFNGALTIRGVVAAPGGGTALDLGGLLLDFRWQPLVSKRVSVEALELDDADVELRRDGDSWALNGLPLAMGPDGSGSSWSFDADRLVLRASRLMVVDGATRIRIDLDELRVDNLRSWDQSSVMRVRLAGRINGAPVLMDGTAMPFALTPSFDGTVKADGVDLSPFAKLAGLDTLAGKASANLTIGGRVEPKSLPVQLRGSLSVAQAALETGDTRIAAQSLSWNGSAVAAAGLRGSGTLAAQRPALQVGATRIAAASLSIAADTLEWAGGKGKLAGSAKAEGADLADGSTAIAAATLAWKGNAGFAADGSFRTEFTSEAEQMAVRINGRVIEHARAGASGMVESAVSHGGLPPVAARLEAWAESVAAHEPARELFTVERAEISGLTLSPTDGAIALKAELKNPKALARRGRADWRVESRRVTLERPALDADGDVSIAGLVLASPVARLTRTGDGFVGFASGAPEEEGGAMPAVAVGRLKVTGGRVEFEDRTLSEPVRVMVEAIDVTARDMDSRLPERDSPFTLKARIGASVLAANGSLRPFAPSFSGRMKGDVKSLELPPLSPYAADNLGVHLHTGHFDGDLALTIERGSLDGRMDMVLSNLFVAQPDPNARIAKQADMPVATVLDLLRDSEDRIKLTIPVRGDLKNPDFDVSDAVSQAVGGALKSTLLTTLKVAFPVAALIGYVIDGESHLALEPLPFAPGGAELTAPHRTKLATVADLMRQRPAVVLTLCGVAAQDADWPQVMQEKREEELGILAKLQKLMGTAPKPADTAPDRDALAALADKRAQSVKAWLVEEGGIEPGRLFTCRPQVDTDGKGAPRVDLLL